MEKNKVLNLLWDYFLMTVGSVIFCMAWTSFIIPTGLASGGLTGLCTIIEYATNGAIPMGIPYWIMNIGLLVIGFLSLGRAFGIKTIYVIILTSILFNVLPEFEGLKYYGFVENDEKLLAALIGAALEAVGLGLVLLRGGSSGGTDIDVVYAYIIMLGFSFGIDFVLLGNKSSVQILVFSSKYQEIADHMIHVMHRGVTALQSVGWYSQKESKVLLIVSRKHQMNEVIKDVKAIDPKAFVSVSTAMSVFGEGFEEVKTGINLKKTNKIEEEI